MWTRTSIDHVAQDLRYTFRTLRKHAGFSAAAILSLALGIGANTAMFSLINALLLRSLPVRSPPSSFKRCLSNRAIEGRALVTLQFRLSLPAQTSSPEC